MADKLEPGASSELIKLAAAIRDAAAAFVEAMDEQGRHQKSYWFYSPKANAHVTVFGDVALMYSLLDEIDPDVVRVEIEDPTAVAHIDEEYVGIRLDGRVTYRGGRVEWREYKRHSDLKDPRPRVKRQVAAQRAAAEAVGAHYMLKDERGLVGRHDACLNALTLIGWRNRCQGISSVRERAALETHFAGGDCATLQQLLTFPETDPALMLSCIAESLSSGSLSADLTKPLTRATVITRGTARASNDGEQLEDEPRKIVAARLPTRGDFEGIPSERLDINRWRRPYPGAMKRREEYLRREEAIFLFYDGASDAHIRDKTGLSGPEVLRHVIVCATDDGRGQPIGFVALVPGYLRKYRREAPPPQNNQVEAARGGFSGLFQNLLRDFPEALEVLVDSTLEIAKARELKVKRPSWSSITTSFLTCLTSAFEKAGRAPDAYPFGTGDMAYAAVRKFCKDLLSGNASRWISLRRGRESMERSRLGRGFSPLLRPTRAMQTIALDFHKVNALSAIEVDTPDGGALEAVLPRWWIGRIVCCSTSTSLATTLSLQRNTTKECVLDLVDALVRAPQLRKSLKIRGGYPSGCWQPNQMIPELEFMGVDLLLLDHAWAHESPQVLAKIAQTLGCAICFGSVRQWWQRIPIERSFLETARVTNAVPSSVGSSPADERRNEAGKNAIRYRIRAEDLFDLICDEERVRMSKRGEGNYFNQPLELLRRLKDDVRSSWLPRPLPKERQSDYPLDWIDIPTKIVAGGATNRTSHPPHLRPDGVRFYGDQLANEWSSVGQPVVLQVGRLDFRRSRVFFSGTGKFIDNLTPERKWNLHPLRWRDVVFILREGRKAKRSEDAPDPAVAFAKTQTEKLQRHARKNKTRTQPHDAARTLENMPPSVRAAAASNTDDGEKTDVGDAAERVGSQRSAEPSIPLPKRLPDGFGIQASE